MVIWCCFQSVARTTKIKSSFCLFSHPCLCLMMIPKRTRVWVMQAVELLTDINKLAAQARRFLRSDPKAARPSPSQATPRSPASSSHPGTPPPTYGGDSVTSPLLSPRRSVEGRSQPQSQGLSRNNSTELRSRNLAGPFSAAAAQGDKWDRVIPQSHFSLVQEAVSMPASNF